jgi:tartrate dehydrogenase/decarboxylase/D-malate dehydrogenase
VRIACIAGDGVGPEVVDATVPVLTAAAAAAGTVLEFIDLDWGGERHLRHGQPMPDDAVGVVRTCAGVLFGSVGRPDVPDHVLVRGLIIALRQELDLAVNLRPVRSWDGVPTVLRDGSGIDLVIVRENTEGEYVGVGGRVRRGIGGQLGLEVAVHSEAVIERLARYAFDLARSRRGRLSLVTKSNAMAYGYTLWDEVVAGVAGDYPDITCEHVLVDAMAARMVQKPQSLDVLLCSNLFGDVLSDLAAALVGGMGMAPSANVLPGASPGLFEPVHGSAPDIAGCGVANPVACLLSGALLLDHVGLAPAGNAVRTAVAVALRDRATHTPDLGGTGTTQGLSKSVLSALNDPDQSSVPLP